MLADTFVAVVLRPCNGPMNASRSSRSVVTWVTLLLAVNVGRLAGARVGSAAVWGGVRRAVTSMVAAPMDLQSWTRGAVTDVRGPVAQTVRALP